MILTDEIMTKNGCFLNDRGHPFFIQSTRKEATPGT